MILVIISEPDPASTNIQTQLLKQGEWRVEEGLEFSGNPVHTIDIHGVKFWMLKIERRHLEYDNVDKDIQDKLGIQPATIIYASRHKSKSNTRTLTVHPIGNFGEASDYAGGKSETLGLSSPKLMTEAYRILYSKVKDSQLEYPVSFEATHHGPYITTPTFFIEIGSDEHAWVDTDAGRLIAETLIELDVENINNKNFPVAIGVGGGHYAPRISDVARAKKVVFGHIIPSYAIGNEVDKIISEDLLMQAVDKTHGVKLVYFHRKALKKPVYNKLKDWFTSQGLEVVRSSDLENI
jgi:D-aminoacyl-tRNA deacylase